MGFKRLSWFSFEVNPALKGIKVNNKKAINPFKQENKGKNGF